MITSYSTFVAVALKKLYTKQHLEPRFEYCFTLFLYFAMTVRINSMLYCCVFHKTKCYLTFIKSNSLCIIDLFDWLLRFGVRNDKFGYHFCLDQLNKKQILFAKHFETHLEYCAISFLVCFSRCVHIHLLAVIVSCH